MYYIMVITVSSNHNYMLLHKSTKKKSTISLTIYIYYFGIMLFLHDIRGSFTPSL